MISISSYTDKLQEIKNLSIPDRKIDPEKEPVFSVNMNTRKISVPDIFRNLAVKGDHLSEIIWFSFDRYFDGDDLEQKAAGLQFTNSFGHTGMLPANFKQNYIGENKQPTLLLGWYITKELTEVAGAVDIAIRFFTVSDTELLYSLGTANATVNIQDALYVTDESENLIPAQDSLSQLVSRIEEIYQNNQATAIDYAVAKNKPEVNDVKLQGKMYTNEDKAKDAHGDGYLQHYIPISYGDLLDYPMINGHPLTPNSTSKSLEISVDVDSTLSSSSLNPVQNRVVNTAITEVNTNITAIKQDLTAIWEELDGMTYIPLSIVEFSHLYGLAEKGSLVSTIPFQWKLGGNAVELTLDGKSLEVTQTSTTLEGLSIENDKEFTLIAKDRKGTEVSAATNLLFAYKVFKNTASEPFEYNSDFLNSLGGELQLTRESNFNVNAEVGEYIYYAVPSSYGDCIFTSGGFTGGFKKVATLSHTNDYGSVTNYDIWKSDYSGLGDTNIIVS